MNHQRLMLREILSIKPQYLINVWEIAIENEEKNLRITDFNVCLSNVWLIGFLEKNVIIKKYFNKV